MARLPHQCSSMDELRIEIDRIDQSLMELFAERWAYIGRAAEIKREVGLPADIPARVEEVKANVRALASSMALDPDTYEAIWVRLIARSIAYEKQALGEDVAE